MSSMLPRHIAYMRSQGLDAVKRIRGSISFCETSRCVSLDLTMIERTIVSLADNEDRSKRENPFVV
jgi:hypothetical protein